METVYPKLLPLLLLLLLLHFPFSACTIPVGSALYASGSNQSWSSPDFNFSVTFVPASYPDSFVAAVSFAGNVSIWSAGSNNHFAFSSPAPSVLSMAPTPPSGIPERITSALFPHRLNNSLIYWNQGLKSSSTNLSSPILGLQTSGVLSIFDSALHGGSETVYSDDFSESGNTFRFLKLDDDGNLRIYNSATRTVALWCLNGRLLLTNVSFMDIWKLWDL